MRVSSKITDWMDGKYTIIKCYPPRICPSIRIRKHYHQDNPLSNKDIGIALVGLPVFPGFKMKAALMHGSTGFIEILEGNSTGVITLNTIVISIEESNPKDFSESNDAKYAKTAVVDAIISRIVDPVVNHQLPQPARLRGVLLYGPPGTGKTYAISSVQYHCRNKCTIHIYNVNITELLSLDVDAAILRMKQIFTTAAKPTIKAIGTSVSASPGSTKSAGSSATTTPQQYSRARTSLSPAPISGTARHSFTPTTKSTTATQSTPNKPTTPAQKTASVQDDIKEMSFVLLDEIDALGSAQDSLDTQNSIKSFICKWFDEASVLPPAGVKSSVPVCVVATSNRPAAVDAGLRRGGRLEWEVAVTSASDSALGDRRSLLLTMLQAFLPSPSTTEAETIDIDEVAERVAMATGGYVAADLLALSRQVFSQITNKTPLPATTAQSSAPLSSTQALVANFLHAMEKVTPSSLRGVTLQLPALTLDDVIGHVATKQSLLRLLSFYNPAKRRLIQRFQVSSPGGALLYGPPGNSKTRLVLACAATMQLPVISLSVADIYSPYVGDAEAEIRKAFAMARQSAPCLLFLDEVDAVVTDRATESSSTGAESRVLATLLVEMDGLGSHSGEQGIFVVGATNRIDCIDAALLRKGRFHHLLHMKPPDADDRVKLLKYFCSKFGLSTDSFDRLRMVPTLVDNDSGVNGAEIEGLCREEAMRYLRESILLNKASINS